MGRIDPIGRNEKAQRAITTYYVVQVKKALTRALTECGKNDKEIQA